MLYWCFTYETNKKATYSKQAWEKQEKAAQKQDIKQLCVRTVQECVCVLVVSGLH